MQSRSRPEWHCHGGGTSGEGPACVTLDVDDFEDYDDDIYIMMFVCVSQKMITPYPPKLSAGGVK